MSVLLVKESQKLVHLWSRPFEGRDVDKERWPSSSLLSSTVSFLLAYRRGRGPEWLCSPVQQSYILEVISFSITILLTYVPDPWTSSCVLLLFWPSLATDGTSYQGPELLIIANIFSQWTFLDEPLWWRLRRVLWIVSLRMVCPVFNDKWAFAK